MAHYITAYVTPGRDQQDKAWVLGAIANDASGCQVAANPDFDPAAAAAATGVGETTLRNWAATMREYIADARRIEYDDEQKTYAPVRPTTPRFLKMLAADAVKEWNYF